MYIRVGQPSYDLAQPTLSLHWFSNTLSIHATFHNWPSIYLLPSVALQADMSTLTCHRKMFIIHL